MLLSRYQGGPLQPQPVSDGSFRDALARGQGFDVVDRGEGIERSCDGLSLERLRVDTKDALGAEQEQDIQVGPVLDQDRLGCGADQVEAPHHHLAGARAIDPGRGEMAPDQGSRGQAPTEFFEDEHRIGAAQAEATGGFGQPEIEDPHLREFVPEGAIEGVLLLEVAQLVDRDSTLAEAADPLLKRFLVGMDSEIHFPSRRSLLLPSGASATRGCAAR